MIAYLTGRVLRVESSFSILLAGQVGYAVSVAQTCQIYLRKCLEDQRDATLWIQETVREGQVCLYGFETLYEQEWFQFLTQVPGVGAKMALSILSAFQGRDIFIMVQQGDVKQLTQAPGVGTKIAGRIINDLKERLKGREDMGGRDGAVQGPEDDRCTLAVQALCHFGYAMKQVRGFVLDCLQQTPGVTVEAIIVKGLRDLKTDI